MEPDKVDAFRKELQELINCHSRENESNTPDFILAEYLTSCLAAFDHAVNLRTRWYPHPDPNERGVLRFPPLED